MSNMHVLTQHSGAFRIVAHIAIPVGNNTAGIAWRTALVASGLGGKTVLPDGDGTIGTISAAEKASIAAGSVYEDVTDLDVTHDQTAHGQALTGAQLAAIVDAWYAGHVTAVLASLQDQLVWFGQTR
jgi:hypothetical protein